MLIEVAEEVEDKRTIRDRLPDVTKGGHHAFHPAAILGDGEVP